MYNYLQLAKKYIRYLFTAANGKGHGTHSPFVFHFITSILNDRSAYPAYDQVEQLRKKLLNNRAQLTIEDMGAGSVSGNTNTRSIAVLARSAAKPPHLAQLIFRMASFYQPDTILELGTSLGITTSYLSLARPSASIITLEGAGAVAAVAKENFSSLQLQNISLIQGNFDDTLASAISRLSSLDFVFIDGNHRQEPTERYFHQLLPHVHNDSILIFDDIHWSREMEAAWETIKADPQVRCTIDLFFIGIVVFRQEFREKQHFTIRF